MQQAAQAHFTNLCASAVPSGRVPFVPRGEEAWERRVWPGLCWSKSARRVWQGWSECTHGEAYQGLLCISILALHMRHAAPTCSCSSMIAIPWAAWGSAEFAPCITRHVALVLLSPLMGTIMCLNVETTPRLVLCSPLQRSSVFVICWEAMIQACTVDMSTSGHSHLDALSDCAVHCCAQLDPMSPKQSGDIAEFQHLLQIDRETSLSN